MSTMMVAARSDGLGERLNAMLNGMFLAERLGYRFGFHWSSSGTWQKLGADDAHHAVVPQEEFFSSDFIERFAITGFSSKGYVEMSGKGLTRDGAAAAEKKPGFRGWVAPRVDIRDILVKELHPDAELNLGKMFDKIGFHSRINAAISEARQLESPGTFAAFHLRSGDIFYGPYRKRVNFTYKGVTLPIAKAMIRRTIDEGCSVLLFGQDLEVMRYLEAETGALVAEDIRPSWLRRPDEVAMFELVLMSRCRFILGGTSGFAKQASWIGGTVVKQPADFFNHIQQTEISIRDLAENADGYNALQSAFAYWYAYFYGRKFKSFESADHLLECAYHYDGDNQLYVLKRAANCFKHGHFLVGDEHLKRMIDAEIERGYEGDVPSLGILVAKTLGKFNLEEDFPHFERAAEEGMPYAALCAYVVRRDKGDVACEDVLKRSRDDLLGKDPAYSKAYRRIVRRAT